MSATPTSKGTREGFGPPFAPGLYFFGPVGLYFFHWSTNMEPRTLTARFNLGQELTHYELQQVYKRITGRPLPSGRRGADVARQRAALCGAV